MSGYVSHDKVSSSILDVASEGRTDTNGAAVNTTNCDATQYNAIYKPQNRAEQI